MKISHIKKMNGPKYKIVLINGDSFIIYEDTILKHNILFKKELDDLLIEQIKKESFYYEVYHKVLKYIMIKLRSKKEIRVYLEKYPLDEQDKNQIIEKLEEIGLLNEEKYARAFAVDKLNLGNYGPDKIRSELEQNEIDFNIIEEVLSSLDEEVVYRKLVKLVTKKVKSNHKYSEYYLKQKIITELVNLGFNREQIISVFDEIYKKNDEVIKREYEKLYTKLSKKYEGINLNYQIKQRLYQKGFTKEEIDIAYKKNND